jgi:hypothetical protein
MLPSVCYRSWFQSLVQGEEELMNPYDVCVVFGDDEICCHQVWAANESEAHHSVMMIYKDSTVVGVVFGSDVKEGI